MREWTDQKTREVGIAWKSCEDVETQTINVSGQI